METIQKHVRKLELGEIQSYRNLAIAPILGEDSNLEHIVLADALQSGFEIREKGQGSVPSLFAANRTGKYVLAIAGESVVGGMQNRTIIKNIYFDKTFEGEIPVRCVQQGRWSYGVPDIQPRIPRIPRPRQPYFPFEPEPVSPGKREYVFAHGGRAPLRAFSAKSQGEAWNAIGEILCCESVRSVTSDLNAVYEEKQEDFNKYRENFPLVSKQVGNVAVMGKNGQKIFVVDLFDRHGILEKHHKNLIDSYALEAGLRTESKVETNEQELRGFLDSVDSCDFQEQRAVSVGKDYVISGAGLEGSALLFNDTFVYTNFFTKKHNSSEQERRSDRSGVIRNFSSGFYRAF